MQKAKWVVVGLACLVLLYLMVRPFIDVIAYSMFIYYLARPVNARLQKHVKFKALAVYVSLLTVIMPVTVVILYTAGVASLELLVLANTLDIPYIKNVDKLVSDYETLVSTLSLEEFVGILRENPDFGQAVGVLLDFITGTIGIIFRLLLIFLTAYVMLRDGPAFRAWSLDRIFHEDRRLAESFMKDVDRDLQGLFHGSILTAVIIAVIAIVLFSMLNSIAPGVRVPYPFLLGILCGFTSLIPGVGVALVWAPTTVILCIEAYLNGVLNQQWWFILLFLAATALIADFIPNWVIRPKVSGKGVNEKLMLFAYILGPMSFGFSGILTAPVLLIVSVNFARTVLPELKVI